MPVAITITSPLSAYTLLASTSSCGSGAATVWPSNATIASTLSAYNHLSSVRLGGLVLPRRGNLVLEIRAGHQDLDGAAATQIGAHYVTRESGI
jgi:hypothetical protein